MKIKRKKFLKLAALLMTLAVAISAVQLLAEREVHAADYTISACDTPADIDTINSTIAAAPNSTLYTIEFPNNCTITKQITIPANKNIAITSAIPASPVTLTRDVNYAGRLISLSAATSQLTLTNIILDGNKTVIANNIASSLPAATVNTPLVYGAAGSKINIADGTVLRNNSTTGNGGAIGMTNGTSTNLNTVTISGSAKIYGNYATNGGGVYTGNYANVTISGDVQVTGNETSSNYAGVYVGSGSQVEVKDRVLVSGNIAGGSHGGIAVNSSEALPSTFAMKDDVKVTDNNAVTNGSGVFIGIGGQLDISGRVEISGNKSGYSGPSIYSQGASKVNISGDVVLKNNHGALVGAGSGGGIRMGNATELVPSVLNISGNVEISGNTMGSQPNDSGTGNGGAIVTMGGYIEINISDSVVISGNSANLDGGGLYVAATNNYDINISGSARFTNNTAGTNGGGIWTDYLNLDKLNVGSGVTFSGNSAWEYDPAVAPVDLAVYNAHILKANNTWSTNPSTSTSFLRGYNNYDISYTAVKYNVTYDSAGGSVVADDVVYDGDTATQPTDPVRDGYKFIGWYVLDAVSGDLAAWDFSTVLTDNLALVAQWQYIPGAPNTGSGLGELAKKDSALSLLAVLIVTVAVMAALAASRKLRRA